MHRLRAEHAGSQGMVEVADRRALLEHIDHQRARREQFRLELLFAGVVRADPRDEATGTHLLPGQEVLPRWSAGHNHVALAGFTHGRRGIQCHRLEAQSFPDPAHQVCRGEGIAVVRVHSSERQHPRQAFDLSPALPATPEQHEYAGIGTREVPGRDRGGRPGPESGDLDRVQQREQAAVLRVTERHDSLNGGEACPGRVVGEIPVELRGEVIAFQSERRRLDVKTSAFDVDAEHRGSRSGSLGAALKCRLHCRDTILRRQQGPHVVPREQQGFRVHPPPPPRSSNPASAPPNTTRPEGTRVRITTTSAASASNAVGTS